MSKNTERSLDELQKLPKSLHGRVPAIRVIAMPADTNPAGDVFGGWLLSHMDLAGSSHAYKYLDIRIVTVGIEAMSFHKPVFVGDQVSFYTSIERIGNTSITMKIESWASRRSGGETQKVTEGLFTYVTMGKDRKTVPIPQDKR
jgi:acyl-CoA thioesterase YciA